MHMFHRIPLVSCPVAFAEFSTKAEGLLKDHNGAYQNSNLWVTTLAYEDTLPIYSSDLQKAVTSNIQRNSDPLYDEQLNAFSILRVFCDRMEAFHRRPWSTPLLHGVSALNILNTIKYYLEKPIPRCSTDYAVLMEILLEAAQELSIGGGPAYGTYQDKHKFKIWMAYAKLQDIEYSMIHLHQLVKAALENSARTEPLHLDIRTHFWKTLFAAPSGQMWPSNSKLESIFIVYEGGNAFHSSDFFDVEVMSRPEAVPLFSNVRHPKLGGDSLVDYHMWSLGDDQETDWTWWANLSTLDLYNMSLSTNAIEFLATLPIYFTLHNILWPSWGFDEFNNEGSEVLRVPQRPGLGYQYMAK